MTSKMTLPNSLMRSPLRARLRTGLAAALALPLFLAGCTSTSAPPVANQVIPKRVTVNASYPARPAVPPPPFKVFHQEDTSITLVTKEDATDDEIESLLWQLRDADRTHSFDKLKISQQWVDKRDPIIWFHIYRGSKCASEKYTSESLPCGASYHAAGDFTYGGFTNHDHDDGVLLHDETHETHLWDPDKPYTPPAP